MRIPKLILWALIFLSLISFASASLVSYWSFDTDATADYGSTDATVTGAKHLTDRCASSGCYSCNGSTDHIDLNFKNISGEFTFNFFYNASGVASQSWLGFESHGSNEKFWYIHRTDGKAQIDMKNESGTGFSKQTADFNLNNASWFFITLRRNSSNNVSFFVNGVQDSTLAANYQDNVAKYHDIYLCAQDDDGSASNPLKMDIDEVSFYDSALTDSEITDLYNSGGIPPTTQQSYIYYNPYYCYQEFANITPACGGTNTGTYNFEGVWTDGLNTIDGDYATYGYYSVGDNPSVYVNYTYPNITHIYKEDTLWQIKSNQPGLPANFSIPQSCLDRSNDTLELKFQSTYTSDNTRWYCRNESEEWDFVYYTSNPFSRVYEEGIYWKFNNLSNKLNTTYLNYVESEGDYYTNNLTIIISMLCEEGLNISANLYIDNIDQNQTINISCNGSTQNYTSKIYYDVEGSHDIAFYLNGSSNPLNNQFIGNDTFIWDFTPPTAILNYSTSGGFNITNFNISLICTDNLATNLNYNFLLNNITLFNGSLANGTVLFNDTKYIDGLNNLTGICSDILYDTRTESLFTSYTKILALIDERENTLFDVENISSVRVYLDDNSTFYDFKENNNSQINFSTISNTKLRFELVYYNEDIVTRYIDINLLEDENIRVCANKEGIPYYEQLILSATQSQARLKSIYSNCYVAADYTRFAYQEAYVLKAYTIDTLYYLTTYDPDTGEFTILSSLDGSISAYINIDALEFKKDGFDLDIISDALSVNKISDTEMAIVYKNLGETNTALLLNITRLDTDTQIFTSSSFANKDNFSMLFNFATLTNVTNATLFQIDLTKTNALGTETIKRYFDTNAKVSILKKAFALTLAILLTIFGLTITVTRLAFSWFGIFTMFAAIIVLSLAPYAWYILFMQVINFIILVYIIIIMTNKNYPTISG